MKKLQVYIQKLLDSKNPLIQWVIILLICVFASLFAVTFTTGLATIINILFP